MNERNSNYTGMLFLKRKLRWWKGETFFFLFLHPYDSKKAEMALYKDQEMEVPFAEAVAEKSLGIHPQSGKPILLFDFSKQSDQRKVALLYAATQIISEAIYHSEADIREAGTIPSGKRPVLIYEDVWQQDFKDHPQIGDDLLKALW
ncbi:MAG: hypothetical protein V4438_02120 [Patescibacteria group bacterium]